MSLLQRVVAYLASIRLRSLFRAIFLALSLATVALALVVLREEKQQAFDNYREGFRKTGDQIAARLRHPTGQLALLNPQAESGSLVPLRPMLLPYAALDFDDPAKVRNAIEMAGCLVQYPNDAALCVAIGANPWAGGFVYAAGRVHSPTLVPHPRGERRLDQAHRLRVRLTWRGEEYRWLAPFELEGELAPDRGKSLRGRLTGFVEREDADYVQTRPVREFRGWAWQAGECSDPQAGEDCAREVFYSLRLPVDLLREALFDKKRLQWPPPDLADIRVQIQVLPPGSDTPFFDSNDDAARAPFLLSELQPLLLPGESLSIRKLGAKLAPELIHLRGSEVASDDTSPLIQGLIRRLPVDDDILALESREEISTQNGRYEILLSGDVRSANRILARVVTRVSWFVAAMLGAVFLAWFMIELGIIRRIAKLTRRVVAAQRAATTAQGLDSLKVDDLRSGDELGILASCLHDLQRRVREDMAREKIRAEQEKDLWHAVGHEIMSPLQSLLALHGEEGDPSRRYIERMQQAVRVLYGSASPSEAFETTQLQVEPLDIDAFLQAVAGNAPCAGLGQVAYQPRGEPLWVRADEYPLEDVVTHILKNAERFRLPDSPIEIHLETGEGRTHIAIRNRGPQIPADMLDKIFEYGVSDQADSAAQGNRGQGLFVAKTYMAKMGGRITVRNLDDGVEFVLSLLRAA
jgi:signal transduction histidine kinase